MIKKITSWFLALALTVFLLTACTTNTSTSKVDLSSTSNNSSNKMLVHYIDVGQGDSTLIQVNNKNMLIDAGPKESKDKLFNYLDKLNIKTLDYVVATHPHEDHIGNMAEVIKKYTIGSFYAPKVTSTTSSFEKMTEALAMKDLKINVIKSNSKNIDLGSNTVTTVMSPSKDSYEDLNNYSPIIKIQFGDTSFLFTGDAERLVEEEVLAAGFDVNADVLKVGHHGSNSSTSSKFLDSVKPKISVISVGANNTYNHPTKKTLDSLNKSKTTIYRTDLDSTVVISSDGTTVSKTL